MKKQEYPTPSENIFLCKALSHEMKIKEVRLLEKTGGKSDFKSS